MGLKLKIILNKHSKIFIAGHKGMVGSACWRLFKSRGYTNLIGKSSSELDLRNQADVNTFFISEKPEVVIDAAAKVGGILANNEDPYAFLMENMLIQNNIIKAAHEKKIKKLIFLGSSCIYPKYSPQPIKEEYLLSDSLEETNQWYALAKITGVKLCEAIYKKHNKQFISLMPTNLYGSNDNYNLKSSHVLPALIRKFHEAKLNQHTTVNLWGTGNPYREFLYVDDLVSAILYALENNLNDSIYNIGSGSEISIRDLATLVQGIIGHKGKIHWDISKPDGTPRKLLDSNKFESLFQYTKTEIAEGIKLTYEDFKKNYDHHKRNN